MDRDDRVKDRAMDMFHSLPDLYKSTDGIRRYTNMEDAVGEITQAEWIAIARELRSGTTCTAGELLKTALHHICLKNAEYEEERN